MNATAIRIDDDTIQITITGVKIATVEPPAEKPPENPPEKPVDPELIPFTCDKSKLYYGDVVGIKGLWETTGGVGSPEAFAAQIVRNADLWIGASRPENLPPLAEAVQFIEDWPRYFKPYPEFMAKFAKYFK